MPVTGKLEVTIKFSEFPEAKTVENGWRSFEVDCDGQLNQHHRQAEGLEETGRCSSELSDVGSSDRWEDWRGD